MRRGPPPIAVRIPISRSRVEARDRLRLATLAQAITRTSSAAAERMPRRDATPPTSAACSGTTTRSRFQSSGIFQGNCCRTSCWKRRSSAWALAAVTPGRSRATIGMKSPAQYATVVPRIERQRHPDLRPPRRQIDAGREHADDLPRPAVDDDRPADHAGIGAETRAPQRVAQEHDGVAGRLILAGTESGRAPG